MDEARGRYPTWWDVALSLAVAAGIAAACIFRLSTPPPSTLTVAFGLVAAVILLGRTRAPVATLLALAPCSVLPTLIADTYPDFYASFVPAVAGVYAVALRSSTRNAVVVPLFVPTVLVCYAARVPSFLTAAQVIYTVTGLTLAFAAGRTMRMLRHHADQEAARADLEASRADLMERERDLQTREAVVAERERIARELHDVIAHDVAVMVVQAGAAERVMPQRPAQAIESLAQIQASGRKAIDELHLLLGMLRDDEQALVSQPGLHAVSTLVEELRRTGLPVSLEVTGPVRDVGDALDVSAYRLVQEALTNVLKHASGSRTQVTVRYDTTSLTVAVVDDGDGSPESSHPLPASGHGIVGMRERVRMFGGTLAAGARVGGGWAVTAVLPIPMASS